MGLVRHPLLCVAANNYNRIGAVNRSYLVCLLPTVHVFITKMKNKQKIQLTLSVSKGRRYCINEQNRLLAILKQDLEPTLRHELETMYVNLHCVEDAMRVVLYWL